MNLNQEFHYANTSTVLKLYNIYTCDFYGSNLWDLYSRDVQKLLNSWNIDQLFMFRLETIFIFYTLFLFLSYHIVPFYFFVRNKFMIMIRNNFGNN